MLSLIKSLEIEHSSYKGLDFPPKYHDRQEKLGHLSMSRLGNISVSGLPTSGFAKKSGDYRKLAFTIKRISLCV